MKEEHPCRAILINCWFHGETITLFIAGWMRQKAQRKVPAEPIKPGLRTGL
jgi:hypothetical protein